MHKIMSKACFMDLIVAIPHFLGQHQPNYYNLPKLLKHVMVKITGNSMSN